MHFQFKAIPFEDVLRKLQSKVSSLSLLLLEYLIYELSFIYSIFLNAAEQLLKIA